MYIYIHINILFISSYILISQHNSLHFSGLHHGVARKDQRAPALVAVVAGLWPQQNDVKAKLLRRISSAPGTMIFGNFAFLHIFARFLPTLHLFQIFLVGTCWHRFESPTPSANLFLGFCLDWIQGAYVPSGYATINTNQTPSRRYLELSHPILSS